MRGSVAGICVLKEVQGCNIGVLKADDGSDEKANGIALSARQDAKLPRIVIVHAVCLYWDCSNVSTNLVDGCSQHCRLHIPNRVAVNAGVAD
jgi:hypothetical protein